MKKHYLIEIPPRKSGIYLILNLLKKKAYVGLAQNLCSRTLDHFKAVCITHEGETAIKVYQNGKIVEVEVNENINILKEENRNFLHIPIYSYKDTDYELTEIETAFMSIVKEAGFELYNTAKINYSYPKKLLPIKDKLCSSLNKALDKLDLPDIGALAKLKKPNATWDKLVNYFGKEKENRFVLTKEEDARYMTDGNYAKVYGKLESFYISKEKINELKLDKQIPTVSLLAGDKTSTDIRALMKSEIIISNFGTHNGESPYEILTRKTLDIKQCGYTYWAFKKGTNIEYYAEQLQKSGERDDVYILLKTTSSDNSGGYNPKPDLISSKEEKLILSDDANKRKWNKTDLKHAFFHDNHWTLFPKEMLSVTSPRGDGYFEGMSRAFKIDKFLLCGENFDIKEHTGQQPTYLHIFKEDFFQQNFPCDDSASAIIARLKYPYIVPISHTPPLSLFLDCVDSEESPMLLEKDNDLNVKRYFLFLKNNVNIHRFNSPLTYSAFVDAYYRSQIGQLPDAKYQQYNFSSKLCYAEAESVDIVPYEKLTVKEHNETLLIDPNLDTPEKEPVKLKGDRQLSRIFRFYPAEPRVIIETESGSIDKNKIIKRVIFLCRKGDQRKAWVYQLEESLTIADLEGDDAAHPDSNTKLWMECLDGAKTGKLNISAGNFACEYNLGEQTAVITVTTDNAPDIRIELDSKLVKNCAYLNGKHQYAYYTFLQNGCRLQYSFRYRDKMLGSIFTPPFIIDDVKYIKK